MTGRVQTAILSIFETNPFRVASVITLHRHLTARGFEITEVEVRDHCEEMTEAGTLRFVTEVETASAADGTDDSSNDRPSSRRSAASRMCTFWCPND